MNKHLFAAAIALSFAAAAHAAPCDTTTGKFAAPLTYSAAKGRPNTTEIVMDADEYKVLSSFTNWATGRKYVKGDIVLVAPAEMKNYEWAISQGKMKKTGGRQRKKVAVSNDKRDE